MSFDQDPHEQANISAADFAMMCAEMKELKQKVSQLESIIAECRDSAGFGTDNDPMNVTGCAALGSPEEVPAFIKDQFDRLRNDRQWQPIETAPRDGTRILLYRPLAETTHDDIIDIKRGMPSDQTCWAKTIPQGMDSTNYTDGYCKPTHWMPLPEAPKHQD